MTAPPLPGSEAADIPQAQDEDGTLVRVVCGSYGATKGPVEGIAADPVYLDVSGAAGAPQDAGGRRHAPGLRLRFRGGPGSSATPPARWRCRTEGLGWADTTLPTQAENCSLVLFDRGDEIAVQAGEDGSDSC